MRNTLNTLLIVMAFLVFGIFVIGCTYSSQYHIDNNFTGLSAAMKANPTVCVLFVHGIAGYSENDPGFMIDQFQKQLNLKSLGDGKPIPLDLADPVANLATLSRQDFSGADNNMLHVYTLTWKPISEAIKGKYIGYDNSADITSTRLSLDQTIKDWLMYQRGGDVVVYAGIGKEDIQSAVRKALKVMHKDVEQHVSAQEKGRQDYKYLFVTWSLGSKIVFDCLKERNSPVTQPLDSTEALDETIFDKIATHTAGVFMLANQLPILAMIDAPTTVRSADAEPVASGLNGFVNRHNRKVSVADPLESSVKATPRLSIVAVSDPNDLLSYPIPDWMRQNTAADFTDVRINVARWGIYIPFLGGTINPATAHTGYGKDSRVIKLIIEGGCKSPGK